MADIAELGIKITYFDGNINKKLKEVEKQAERTKKASDKLAEPPKSLDKALNSWAKLQDRMKELSSTYEKNKLSANNLEPLTKEINKVRDAAYEMNKAGKLASGAIEQVSRRIAQFGAFIAAAFIVTGIQKSISGAVRAIADFDQALYNLQAITTSTRAEAEVMGDTIVDVARETKFSASEVAEGMRLIGQAGFSASESMQAIGAISKLATGTMSDFGSVVDLTTTTIRAFHLQSVETGKVADIFASAINNSKLSIDKLQVAFNYVGAAGKQAGLTLEETTASLMILANNGIKASTMGTGLRKMLLSLISPNLGLRTALNSVGMSMAEINPQAVGMEKALENLTKIMWDNEKQAVDVGKAQQYFGIRAAQVAAILGESVAKGGAFSRALEQTNDLGAATRMAELQQKGLIVQFKNLQDRAKNVALALGEAGLNGVLKSMVGGLRDGASYIETFFKAFPAVPQITGIALAVGAVTAAISALQVVTIASSKYLKLFWAALSGPVGIITASVTGLIATFVHFSNQLERQIDLQRKNAVAIRKGIDAIDDWRTALVMAYAESEKSYKNTVSRFIQENPKISAQVVQMANEMERFGKEGVASIEGILTKTTSLEEANEIILKLFDNIKAEEAKKEIDTLASSIESLNEKMEMGQARDVSPETKRWVSEAQLEIMNKKTKEFNEQQKQLALSSNEVQRELNLLSKALVNNAQNTGASIEEVEKYIKAMKIDEAWKETLIKMVNESKEWADKTKKDVDITAKVFSDLPKDIQKAISSFKPVEFYDFAKVRKSIEEEVGMIIEFFNTNKDKMMLKFKVESEDYDDFVTDLAKGVRDSKLREYLQGAEKDTESLAEKLLKLQDKLFPDKAKLRELNAELKLLQSLTEDQAADFDVTGMIAKIQEMIDEIENGKKATEDWKTTLESLEASFFPDQTKLKEVKEQIAILEKALELPDVDTSRIDAVLDQLKELKDTLESTEVESYADKLKALGISAKDLGLNIGPTTEEFNRQADILEVLSKLLDDGVISLEKFRGAQDKLLNNDKSKRYLEDYSNAANDTFSNIETALNSSFSSMENTLVEFVTKGKASFKDFANSVISDISRVLIRQSITGPLSTWMGDVFSPAQAEVNINAKGGIYSGAGISAYSSSIVDTPTMFPFAKGIGLMGEAGAEAILPLTRTSGGELGVRAKNESSNVSVQIIDQRTNSNAQNIQTEESEGADGQKILRVMIRDEIRNSINNGALDTTFKGNMGISRRPIRR